jgi:hypothetical protein
MTDMPGVPAILRGAAAALLVAGVAACGVATPTSGGAATLAASAGGRPSSAATGQPPGTCLRRIGITVDGVLPVEYVFAATGSLAGAECAGVGDVVAQLNGTSVMVAAVPPGWRMACGTTSGATLWTGSSAVALTVCQGVPGRPTLPRVCGCDQADGSQPTQAAVRPSRAQRT